MDKPFGTILFVLMFIISMLVGAFIFIDNQIIEVMISVVAVACLGIAIKIGYGTFTYGMWLFAMLYYIMYILINYYGDCINKIPNNIHLMCDKNCPANISGKVYCNSRFCIKAADNSCKCNEESVLNHLLSKCPQEQQDKYIFHKYSLYIYKYVGILSLFIAIVGTLSKFMGVY